MRIALGEALVIGVGVGVAVLVVRWLLGDAPVYVQLIALLCVGVIIGGLQIALVRRSPSRAVGDRPPVEVLAQPAGPPPAPADDRDHAWTGLELPADAAVSGALPAGDEPAPAMAATLSGSGAEQEPGER